MAYTHLPAHARHSPHTCLHTLPYLQTAATLRGLGCLLHSPLHCRLPRRCIRAEPPAGTFAFHRCYARATIRQRDFPSTWTFAILRRLRLRYRCLHTRHDGKTSTRCPARWRAASTLSMALLKIGGSSSGDMVMCVNIIAWRRGKQQTRRKHRRCAKSTNNVGGRADNTTRAACGRAASSAGYRDYRHGISANRRARAFATFAGADHHKNIMALLVPAADTRAAGANRRVSSGGYHLRAYLLLRCTLNALYLVASSVSAYMARRNMYMWRCVNASDVSATTAWR